MTTKIADLLQPAELAELEQAFRLETAHFTSGASDWNDDDWIESHMGLVTASHLWDAMWRFGIVLDDDCAKVRNLGDYWRPDGSLETGYYVPCDYDTKVSVISIDHPPTEDAAWDARPL